MARTPKIPKYCLHKATGRGYAYWGDRRRPTYYGPFGSPQSRALYDGDLARWLAAGRPVATAPPPQEAATLVSLVASFMRHGQAVGLYRKGGRETSEWWCLRSAFRALVDACPGLPVAQFDPQQLDVLRAHMARLDWATGTIRKAIARVKGLLRWGEDRGLTPLGLTARLDAAQRGLGSGGRKKGGNKPIKKLPDPFAVGAVALVAGEPIASMIWLQRLNGMRPEGVCVLRPCDIERLGDLWKYTEPEGIAAKTGAEHHWLGPRAQAILQPFLDDARSPTAFLFHPSRRPGAATRGRMTRPHYARTVARLCAKLGVTHWAPSQLRNWHLQEVRNRYGRESAQVRASHARPETTDLYTESQVALAQKVAREIG